MKKSVILAGLALTTLCFLAGCSSEIGGPKYNDTGGNFANYSTMQNIENFTQPGKSVYK